MAVYELLYYIFTNERHQKYLDNVKHPAKKGKQAKDMIEMLMDEGDEENQEVVSVTQSQGSANVGEHGQSKSSRLTNRIQDIINSELVKEKVQREFENLIDWIVGIEQKLKNIMAKKKGAPDSGFKNVNYKSFLTALFGLMDARVLTKDL